MLSRYDGDTMAEQAQEFLESAHVWFTGVGPGVPDLLTVKAHKLLSSADVIFHEGQQINKDILALRKANATLVNCDNVSAHENALHCHAFAQEGKLVARLVTGDPCIFSPALEEIEMVQAKGTPCAIIPGISAAFWAAALARKSLTPKHTHQAFTIMRVPITAPLPAGQSIKDMCQTGTCLAIYLANKNPKAIVDECLQAGLSRTAPVLLIESTGNDDEKISWLELASLPKRLRNTKSQSLVLIWP